LLGRVGTARTVLVVTTTAPAVIGPKVHVLKLLESAESHRLNKNTYATVSEDLAQGVGAPSPAVQQTGPGIAEPEGSLTAPESVAPACAWSSATADHGSATAVKQQTKRLPP